MKKQQALSLYLAIIIMVILLAIVLGISTILLSQLKTLKGMENSVIAFYAAETGIEKVLVDRGSPNTTPGYYDGSVGDATYEVTVTPLPAPDYFQIRSVGTYKSTKRAIEVSY